MKNQTEWIIRGVFAVIAIGVICYSIFGAREPITPPEPEKPPLTKVALPEPAIVYKNELPGGGDGGAGGGGGLGAPGGPGGGAPTRVGK